MKQTKGPVYKEKFSTVIKVSGTREVLQCIMVGNLLGRVLETTKSEVRFSLHDVVMLVLASDGP